MPVDIQDESIVNAIHKLIQQCEGAPDSFAGNLTTQMIQTSLKLLLEQHDIGQLKLITHAVKEMRHAYRVFNKYPDAKCVSIFGSARTPVSHPDYKIAKHFAGLMAKQGWMCITGAAEGIMHAGIKGAKTASSFGLSIRLPTETTSNSTIHGDPKSMMFRYFFTRKLMFLTHASAVAAFPGGFGTHDELFEVLTLMQTGKNPIVPLVLLCGEKGEFWQAWEKYMRGNLYHHGWISKEDENLYHISPTAAEAKKHILQFYKIYHSSRYVNEALVIRLNHSLNPKQMAELNRDFKPLVAEGEMVLQKALPEESVFTHLPRVVFQHTRRNYGLLRVLIDRINTFKV